MTVTEYEVNALADLLAQFGFELVGQEAGKVSRALAWRRGEGLGDHVRIEYRLTGEHDDST